MDFGLAFSYPFQDQDWLKKLGIAGLLLIIPLVGGFAVLGWGLEITRRVIRHDTPLLLPEWNEFGKYIVDGLYIYLISIIYSIPIIIFSSIIGGGGGLLGQNQGSGGGDPISIVVWILLVCGSCLIFLYLILFSLVIPAAIANFAVKGNLGAAFAFGELFGIIKSAFGAYIIVLLGGIVAGFLSTLGLIACIIGVVFTAAYYYLIMAHFYGQAYNQAQSAMGVSNPPAPMANI